MFNFLKKLPNYFQRGYNRKKKKTKAVKRMMNKKKKM
jgi:hypothetical protein